MRHMVVVYSMDLSGMACAQTAVPWGTTLVHGTDGRHEPDVLDLAGPMRRRLRREA